MIGSEGENRLPMVVNDKYKDLAVNYENFFLIGADSWDSDADLMHHVKRVTFELSNICCYSPFHPKCPANLAEEKIVLSSTVIQKIIDELASINYTGVFAFHMYNEPLMDPRLFSLMIYAKEKCPGCKLFILTNGYYLNQTIANEIANLDIWILSVTAYSLAEYERIKRLSVPCPFRMTYVAFDNRASTYDLSPLNIKKPCLAPVRDICIACTGELILCSYDWKHIHKFGNVYTETLSKILARDELKNAYENLKNGNRILHLCQRCSHTR